jgi:hypothetical protein
MEEIMDEQTQSAPSKPKKRLVRKRKTDLALESALRDAAAATERHADPATKGLIQTRLNILNQQLTRERNEKLKRAIGEVERLRLENEVLLAENSRLTKELAAARGEIQRLQTVRGATFGTSLDERLKAIDAEHAGRNQ